MPETTCVVPNCSRKGQHRFPKDKLRRDAWIHAIRRGKSKFTKWSPPSKYSYVCRNHFVEDDYESLTYHGTERQKQILKKTAIPSRFSWTENVSVSSARKERAQMRSEKRRKLFHEVENTEESPMYFASKLETCDLGACEYVCTESNVQQNDIPDEQTELEQRPKTDAEVQTAKTPMYCIHNFEKDAAGVHFYTGLENYAKFFFVLNTLGPAVYHLTYIYHAVTNISVADQFFLTLIKLRRHTTNFELSRMFGIAKSVVANVFITWIIFMEKQWKEINIWPCRELVDYFIPSGFRRNYPKTRVIIDGTECPVKRPKNPTSQQATFSTYKNRNTVNVLVGATPGGLVSYVSDAYGGPTSDRQIVERSSLVSMCDRHDSIMADKCFNVQDLFASKDIHINIPTFFKKKNRMSRATVLRDRKISSKRVHIERIIGLAKTYKILVEPMTATETKLSTEIIFICFMLCNFRNNIIPKYA